MTIFLNAVGQEQSGNTVFLSDNTFSSVASSTSGQVCQTTTSDPGFQYNSTYACSLKGGVLAETIYNISETSTATANLGTSSSAATFSETYSSTANFLTIPIVPLATGSILKIIVTTSWKYASSTVSSIVVSGFLNATGAAILNLLSIGYVSGSNPLMPCKGACQLTGLTAGTSYDFNLCAYARNQAGTFLGPWGGAALPNTGGDYIKVIEYLPSNTPNYNSVSPCQVTTSLGTSVLLANFYVPQNKSLTVKGTWFALAFSNGTNGNAGDYMFIAQRGSGDVSLSGNNVMQNTILPLATTPYIYFTVQSGSGNVQMYAVGNGVDTFQFLTYFSTN